MVNPYAPTPAYQQVADAVAARIEAGDLRPLMPIPSETHLVQEFVVSRGTARRAVQELRDRGLVFTVAGRGTFVGERPE